MQGQIKKFRPDLGIGVIEATDGQKFRFKAPSIVNPHGELIASEVDFEAHDGLAADVILLRGDPWHVFGAAARA